MTTSKSSTRNDALTSRADDPSEPIEGTEEEREDQADGGEDEEGADDAEDEDEEFVIDRQAASREPGERERSGERRGKESGADGKE